MTEDLTKMATTPAPDHGDSFMTIEQIRHQKRLADFDKIKDWTADDIKGNKRQADEDFDVYKERRRLEKMWTKLKMKGEKAWVSKHLVWDDVNEMEVNIGGGTYDKNTHGHLTEGDVQRDKKIAERDARGRYGTWADKS